MSQSSQDKIKCLFSWCINQTKNYKNVEIKNFTSSWRNGLGFCAILHRYGPEFIDFDKLNPEDVYENCQLAFKVGEQQFGIPALLDAKDMVIMSIPDRLSIITYLLQFYSTLAPKKQKIVGVNYGLLTPIENISDDRFTEDKVSNTITIEASHEQRDQIKCEICSQIIYFLERLTISDKNYHRACYRQSQLSNLKLRNRTLERPTANSNTQKNESNIESENINKKSRLKSSSPTEKSEVISDNDKKETDLVLDNNNRKSRLKSMSPEHEKVNSEYKIKKDETIKREFENNKKKMKSNISVDNKEKSSDFYVKELNIENNLIYGRSRTRSTSLDDKKTLSTDSSKKQPEVDYNNKLELKPESPENKNISSLKTDEKKSEVENNNKLELKTKLPENKIISSVETVKKESDVDNNNKLKLKYESPENNNVLTDVGNDNMLELKSESPKIKKRLSLENEKNESNNKIDSDFGKSQLGSLSPNSKKMLSPSLDSHLEKISLENLSSKSFHNLSPDHSSQSVSSTNFISINASSSDSLPKSQLEIIEPLKEEEAVLSNKLHPNSLTTSLSSLNSSFGKKRRAPPPPPPPPSSVTNKELDVDLRPIPARKAIIRPESLYPEDLNPFSVQIEPTSNDNDTNPFAEYMTEQSGETPALIEKPTTKPRKRIAPKIPPKPKVVNHESDIKQTIPSQKIEEKEGSLHAPTIPEMKPKLKSLTEQPSVSQKEVTPLIPGITISNVIEGASQPVQNTCTDDTELSIKSASSIITVPTSPSEPLSNEITNKITQTSDKIKKPEPLKRTKKSMEKSKSNDSLNLSISSYKPKLPAPSRPPPPKRKVRGDATNEFIPFDKLYNDLKEVNEQQLELEKKGRSLQNSLNEVSEKDEIYETLLQEWLDIVEKKNVMYSKEHSLHEILRRQELEDRHSDLEYELRLLMGKQESLKTAEEKAREEELLAQILNTVNERARLVDEDEESSRKSSINDLPKKKITLKKMFTSKHRSNSLTKSLFRFKAQKNKEKNIKTSSLFYE